MSCAQNDKIQEAAWEDFNELISTSHSAYELFCNVGCEIGWEKPDFEDVFDVLWK